VFPPDGLADVLMRVLQAPLSSTFLTPFIVENRSGASGNVAAVETMNSGGDGDTSLVTASTTASVNPVMFTRMSLRSA
jgi:tripartite-type tricarboxylate transporter receptor subunit TctC